MTNSFQHTTPPPFNAAFTTMLFIWLSMVGCHCLPLMQFAHPTCMAWPAPSVSHTRTLTFALLHTAKERKRGCDTHSIHAQGREEHSAVLVCLTAVAVAVVSVGMRVLASANGGYCISFSSCWCAQGKERPKVPHSAVLPMSVFLTLCCSFVCCGVGVCGCVWVSV